MKREAAATPVDPARAPAQASTRPPPRSGPPPSRLRRAWAALRRWLKPPRRFPPTREGWWFLAATLVVGGAAINSGFNLLFLMWGMMIFLILASGVLSELCLRKLHVTRLPPGALHAGSPYLMGVAVRNGKRRIPSFSVEIEDLVGEDPVEKRCFFLKIPAHRRQQTAYRNVLSRRGVLRLAGFRVSTKFPFGLIRKSRDVDDPLELIVYPALVPVPADLLAGGATPLGSSDAARRSRRGEFFGLRDFRQGDDPRDVHWRTSARRGRAFVRESEEETGRVASVLFDNAVTADDGAFEAAVSMAASVALALLGRGFTVGLGARGLLLAPGEGAPQATRILRALALIDRATAATALDQPPGGALRVRITPAPTRPAVAVEAAAADRRSA